MLLDDLKTFEPVVGYKYNDIQDSGDKQFCMGIAYACDCLESVVADYFLSPDDDNVLDKIKAQIADEVIGECKFAIISALSEAVVSILDQQIDSISPDICEGQMTLKDMGVKIDE